MTITKEKFDAYKKVQMSGVTNMWDVALVEELSGLEREEILNVMKNYGEYEKLY